MSTVLVFQDPTEPIRVVSPDSAVARPVGPGFAVAVPAEPPASPVLDPYLVYLGRLTGESRRAMAGCLDRLARLAVQAAVSGEQPDAGGPLRPDCEKIR